MSDDLSRALRDAVPDADRPELGALWEAGRGRIRSRRRGRLAAVAVVVVAALGLGALVVGREGPVDTAAAPPKCVPKAGGWQGFVASTAADFVRDGGVLPTRPDAVVRVRVLRVHRIEVGPRVTEGGPFRDNPMSAPKMPTVEHRADVEVVSSIVGPRAGTRLVISDSAVGTMWADLAEAKRTVQKELDRLEAILEVNPDAEQVRADYEDYQERLQLLQLSERLPVDSLGSRRMGTQPPPLSPLPCHRLAKGDDVIVALNKRGDVYELTGANSFFLVDGIRMSPALDADRQTLPGWEDTPLQRLARTSTPAEFVAALRAAR